MRDLLAPSLDRERGDRQEASNSAESGSGHSDHHVVFFDQRSEAGVLQSRIVVEELGGGFLVTDDYQCMEAAVSSLGALEQLNEPKGNR